MNNVRCNCGHYYNIDVHDNVCPECEQTYKGKEEKQIEARGIDIDKYVNVLINIHSNNKRRNVNVAI